MLNITCLSCCRPSSVPDTALQLHSQNRPSSPYVLMDASDFTKNQKTKQILKYDTSLKAFHVRISCAQCTGLWDNQDFICSIPRAKQSVQHSCLLRCQPLSCVPARSSDGKGQAGMSGCIFNREGILNCIQALP